MKPQPSGPPHLRRPIIEKAKVSQRPLLPNMVAYGANTHNGLIRNYNEDRISIVLDLKKPGLNPTSKKQPQFQIQFFAIFDGHGGQGCAEYLRDNLHNFVAGQQEFPDDLENALLLGCRACENEFMKRNLVSVRDRSGSCAVVLLVTPSKVYFANVGDSRAILSRDFGQSKQQITNDHKPGEPSEKNRILGAGGKVYQSNSNAMNLGLGPPILGPERVLPGRLSVSQVLRRFFILILFELMQVSRSFGDCIAKMERYGGNQNCIIAEAEIFSCQIDEALDFILIGSDGIFDRISTEETAQLVLDEARQSSENLKQSTR